MTFIENWYVVILYNKTIIHEKNIIHYLIQMAAAKIFSMQMQFIQVSNRTYK